MVNQRMEKYFKELHDAEFPKDAHDNELETNHKQMIKLLKRAYNWKSLENVQDVVEYLGYDTDSRYETLDGCKEIINMCIEYHKELI